MKYTKYMALAAVGILLSLYHLTAQDTWEERAAARFKALSDNEKRSITRAQPKEAEATPKEKRRILVFWRSEDWIHTSIPTGNFVLQEMARITKVFTVDLADEYSVFTKKNLEQYDAIVFNNTTHLKFPKQSQRDAIKDFIIRGKGIAGIHAASDNFYEWDDGSAIMGGQFCGHPWTANGTYAFKLDDPDHTLNKAFHGRGFWHKDEIYQYDPETYQGEDNLRILVSLDMRKPSTSERLFDKKYAEHNAKFEPGMREVPVSWISTHGKGRLFNTNFGHNESTYTKPVMMKQLLDGIQYALGDLKADATPTAKAKTVTPALSSKLITRILPWVVDRLWWFLKRHDVDRDNH